MTFNTRKTVHMVFNPANRSKRVTDSFPVFTLCNSQLVVVNQFKYLGYIIDNSFSDDSDINREVKALFARTNLPCRRFKRCSKLVFFCSFCTCFYDTALWCNYSVGAISRLTSCYNKCLKYFSWVF